MTDDDEKRRPTVDQPLHGPRRPALPPLIGVVAVLLLVLAVFALITWLRYNT